MILWLTNRGKCKSMLEKIREEMQYRMYVMTYHRDDRDLCQYSWAIWYKLYRWREELTK